MAVLKNTADLLAQAGTTLPDNTVQAISPQDVREMAENTAFSSYNKVTDSALVGLKAYSSLVSYESGQGCTYLGAVYISNTATSPGAFNPAQWDELSSDNLFTADLTLLENRSHDLNQFNISFTWDDGAGFDGSIDINSGAFVFSGNDGADSSGLSLSALGFTLIGGGSNSYIVNAVDAGVTLSHNDGGNLASLALSGGKAVFSGYHEFSNLITPGTPSLNKFQPYIDGSGIFKVKYTDALGVTSDAVVGGNLFTADSTLLVNRSHDLDGNTFQFYGGKFSSKGGDTSGSTTGFEFLDSVGASLWDWRNNGDLKIYKNSSIYCSASNGITIDGVPDGGKLLTIKGRILVKHNFSSTLATIAQFETNSGTIAGRFGNDGSFTVGAVFPLGSEKISLQGYTVVKGHNTSGENRGFGVYNSALTWIFEVRNNGDVYIKGATSLQGDALVSGNFVQYIGTSTPSSGSLINNSGQIWIDSGTPTIQYKDNLGVVVSKPLSGGSVQTFTESIVEANWSGATNYTYSVTAVGVAVGDFCIVTPDEDVLDAIKTAGTTWDGYAYCSTAGQIEVVCRVGAYITIPASSIFTVKVL